jgi:quercetin 2,3-dioxygenase
MAPPPSAVPASTARKGLRLPAGAGAVAPVRAVTGWLRTLVGEGSPVRLGTPALILDVELPDGGQVTTPVPARFQGFAYVLEGEAAFGANRRRARSAQLVLLGPGEEFPVTDAAPGTRFLLMTGQPYRETPVFNGPFVD